MSVPGVHVQEVRSDRRAISGVDSSITAFVGRAARGVTDTPVTVTDFGEFERVFGGRWIGSTLGDSVHDFFQNGGATAVIVRLYRAATGSGAKPSIARVFIRGLELVAADEGSWGNALRARIDFDTRPFDAALGEHEMSLFNLVVRDGTTGVIEEHRDVVVAPANHPRLVTRVLDADSRLVRAARVGRARPAASHTTTDPGQTVWDDNRVPTNATVTTPASDGRALTRTSFIGAGLKAARRGLFALDTAEFNLLVVPPYTRDGSVDAAVVRSAAAYCEQRRAFYLVDGPPTWGGVTDVTSGFATGFDTVVGTTSGNAALYFPRLRRPDRQPAAPATTSAAAGAVAGVIARTDALHGPWKAPAGVDAILREVGEPAVVLTDREIGELTPMGVNGLRSAQGSGLVVWGARTMQGADQLASEWKYIPVRRTALFIEESVVRGTRWAVFEPNGDALWAEITLDVETFVHDLFRGGAFQGSSPRDAFFVRCDQTTTTHADVDGGVVNIEIGFAPLRPAEFVVIRIQQMAGPLAQRIPPRADWSDFDVTEEQAQRLEALCRQVRERDTADLDRGAARDRGVAALFVGEARAATTAAEVVARDLGRDLYRVDLAAVVSKYIGETEKNLRALFDAAEAGGAVLLFDEADALFGARSGVKDSHDRYANLDIADLIQRIESHCGVAILTTNRRSSIDPDILRRLRPVVELRARRRLTNRGPNLS